MTTVAGGVTASNTSDAITSAGTTVDYYANYYTTTSAVPWTYPHPPDIDAARQAMEDELSRKLKELLAKSPFPTNTPKESEPMKSLFAVYVVTKKEEIIINNKVVVAEDANEAQFLTDVAAVLKEKGLKPKDVTILCPCVGSVKVEKEVERVKVVKDE